MSLSFAVSHAPAAVDLNGNGLSDIWELRYNASGVFSNADNTGDGFINYAKSIAGSDPFSSTNRFVITRVTVAGANATVFWSSVVGKRYQVQSTTNLIAWVNEGGLGAGTGVEMQAVVPAGAGAKLFRVLVQDVDTDADSVTDWEELQVGYDPTKASTNGGGTNDLLAITTALQSTNVITITAGNAYAAMTGPVPGTVLVKRSGGLNPVTVNFTLTGTATAGVDFVSIPLSITLPLGVNTGTVTFTPMSNATALVTKLVTLTNANGSASVTIDPLVTPTGTGLFGQYFDNASATYTNATNFTGFAFSRVDTNIDFNWGAGAPTNTMGVDTFSIRWTGQVQPELTEPYYFYVYSNDGAKLWVNGQLIIDRWTNSVAGATGTVALVGGVLYDIKLEYFENTSSASNTLWWWSTSQTKQVIPMERLYPNTNAAANVTSDLTAVGLVGGGFNYQITGSNLPFIYGVTGLPPGLTFNSVTGLITGTPTVAGTYRITLSVGNGRGTGYAILTLTVLNTGGTISRDYWTGVAGASVTNIPVKTTPTGSDTLTNLVGFTNFGSNYGERIRGYLTAPVTGNYYFWLTATNSAELWIGNDSEQVNSLRRCTAVNNRAQSPWLALIAGQKYYIEILHKAGAGAGDTVAVNWLRPDQSGVTNVVPGYVLSPYVPPSTNSLPGTLYAATMLAQGTAVSFGVGAATLRLSADETQAVLIRSFTNLIAVTGEHIHNDSYAGKPSQIMFDIDTVPQQPDGSFIWNIGPVGSLSSTDIVEIIKGGKAYINIHTAAYPSGEIRGNFTLADGARSFTVPPAPPTWSDDSGTTNGAVRFLTQATFGANATDIAAVQSNGFSAWIDDQFTKPVTHHLPYILANVNSDPTNPYPSSGTFNSWWQQSVTAPDQLRQRIAFALSEIMVVSDVGVLNNNALALSDYYDMLLDGAFGNCRQLLENVTLHPAMGLYLDMRANDKGDLASGRIPNENYAREILQLFSIGLYRMWPDGTLILDSTDNLVPTYDQTVIQGFARVFTGWNYFQTNALPTSFSPSANYTNVMTLVPSRHELGAKRILDNVVLPAAAGNQLVSGTPEYSAFGTQDLAAAHDAIFNNPSFGPFICRQLIQRLVTSTPSRDYLYRVVQQFNDDGTGVRGNLQAVIKAILLDYEARSPALLSRTTYGKQREPLLRATGIMRAFPGPAPLTATYNQSGSRLITVTTPTPHRLATGNNIFLQFTSGAPLPTSTGYGITNTGSLTFMVNATGLLTGSYNQVANTITVNTTTHGLILSNHVHLTFTSGGASNALYQLTGVPTTSSFSVPTPDATAQAGLCLIAFNTGGYAQSGSNITVSTSGNHGLSVSDMVSIDFQSGTAPSGVYPVTTVVDEDHFTVFIPMTGSQTQSSLIVAPVAGPPLFRSGNVDIVGSTWSMSATDNDLTQTPLRSPTVFNFFPPDYKFPGILASAGLTTPEFQLTSDSNVANQDNFLAGGIINSQSANTNGINSFKSGGGAVVLDFGPWMTPAYTSSNGVPALVDTLNSLLVAGQLTTGVKTTIVNYVNTLAYTTNAPTQAQMRDRVRAVIHLLVTSPTYTIQK
ncbi:MAG: DUF1800 family protein [Verrucomicrobiota bacterium]